MVTVATAGLAVCLAAFVSSFVTGGMVGLVHDSDRPPTYVLCIIVLSIVCPIAFGIIHHLQWVAE